MVVPLPNPTKVWRTFLGLVCPFVFPSKRPTTPDGIGHFAPEWNSELQFRNHLRVFVWVRSILGFLAGLGRMWRALLEEELDEQSQGQEPAVDCSPLLQQKKGIPSAQPGGLLALSKVSNFAFKSACQSFGCFGGLQKCATSSGFRGGGFRCLRPQKKCQCTVFAVFWHGVS